MNDEHDLDDDYKILFSMCENKDGKQAILIGAKPLHQSITCRTIRHWYYHSNWGMDDILWHLVVNTMQQDGIIELEAWERIRDFAAKQADRIRNFDIAALNDDEAEAYMDEWNPGKYEADSEAADRLFLAELAKDSEADHQLFLASLTKESEGE